MNGQYTYTSYTLLSLASVVFLAALGFYGWRRRAVPGALPFAVLMVFSLLLGVGATFESATSDIFTKVFWYKFQYFWQGPALVAGLWFVLEFARLGHFLTRRVWLFLLAYIFLVSWLILTNDAHHWLWLAPLTEETLPPARGGGYWFLVSPGYLVALLTLPILVWLFVRSPLHRWPVAFILCGQLVVRAALLLGLMEVNPFQPISLTTLGLSFNASMYAIALFGFRLFDPIPAARKTVIERMADGMLALDTHQRIVDVNPTAQALLHSPRKKVVGCEARALLAAYPSLQRLLDDAAITPVEIQNRENSHWYEAHISTLLDTRGFRLGQVLWFHDVTEQKQARALLLEQQRALAVLQERDRVARELHDSLGQVLGYVKMQAQAAREQLAQGQGAVAEEYLAQLVAVAQEAHADVREYILGARAGDAAEIGFLPALQQYLKRFGENYKIRAQLEIPPELTAEMLTPTVEMQLLRIIQEALTNARKHAQAKCVEVKFYLEEDRVQVIVQDDGAGFDPALLGTAEGQKFGLRFMRERAEEVGGRVEIQSAPGEGTRVVICVPRRGE